MAVYPVLKFILFNSVDFIPESLTIDLGQDQQTEERNTLIDKTGAIIGSSLMITTLAVLVGTNTIGVPVWEITVPPALLMLSRDVWHDLSTRRRSRIRIPSPPLEPAVTTGMEMPELRRTSTSSLYSRDRPAHAATIAEPQPPAPTSLAELLHRYTSRLNETLPTVVTVAERLPLALIPFAFLMFIFVQALVRQGWVQVFATWWATWAHKTGMLGAVGGIGFITCILCNVGRLFDCLKHAEWPSPGLRNKHRNNDSLGPCAPVLGIDVADITYTRRCYLRTCSGE